MGTQSDLLTQLHSQLLSFGLNPQDWTVQRMKALNFRITHKTDRNFQFQGILEFKASRPTWKSVELLSI